MNAFQDFEEKITCPYDNAHFIRKSKMSVHLVKCAKNHPNTEISICDYNSCHRVLSTQLRYHHETCPDRRMIENHIIQKGDEDPNSLYPVRQVSVTTDEDWDLDDHPGYDPATYCAKNNILRHVDVQSAAKRRNFRLEERERLNHLGVVEDDSPHEVLKRETKKDTTNRSKPYFLESRVGNNSLKDDQGFAQATCNVDEDASHISLIDRIKRGSQKTYVSHK